VAYRDGQLGEADRVQKRSALEIAAWAIPTATAFGKLGREYIRQRGETDRTKISEQHETTRERVRYGVDKLEDDPTE
jgi:hypothetical protein